MPDKFDGLYNQIIFEVARLIFPNTPILDFHCNIVEQWASHKIRPFVDICSGKPDPNGTVSGSEAMSKICEGSGSIISLKEE